MSAARFSTVGGAAEAACGAWNVWDGVFRAVHGEARALVVVRGCFRYSIDHGATHAEIALARRRLTDVGFEYDEEVEGLVAESLEREVAALSSRCRRAVGR